MKCYSSYNVSMTGKSVTCTGRWKPIGIGTLVPCGYCAHMGAFFQRLRQSRLQIQDLVQTAQPNEALEGMERTFFCNRMILVHFFTRIPAVFALGSGLKSALDGNGDVSWRSGPEQNTNKLWVLLLELLASFRVSGSV